ncbi:hypothetical protein Trydic_g4791 [Trypoxylus dichotomus]
MQKVTFIFSLLFAATLARSNLGEKCGRNNEGEKTLSNDCPSGIIISNVIEANDKWDRSNDVVCCIKERYLKRGERSVRKSEQACKDFGAGIQRKVFQSSYVLPGEYQHNVILGYENEPKRDEIVWKNCGGFLISKNYVITAAHCLRTYRGNPPKMVRLGSIDLNNVADKVIPQDITILSITAHPNFQDKKHINDIALLKLAESANFTDYVQPACLYTKDDVPATMVGTGWAFVESSNDEDLNDLLRKSSVRHVSQESCNKTYESHGGVQDSQFCGLTDTDICYHISGSPAFISNDENSRVTVVGFSTRGIGCSHTKPNIYTKISSFIDWIESNVWP